MLRIIRQAAIAGLVLGITSGVDAGQPPGAPAPGQVKYALPPPFDAHEFLSRLAKLLRVTGGNVTYPVFEKIFGIPTTRGLNDGTSRVYAAGIDWYFHAYITQGDSAVDGIPPTAEHRLHSDLAIDLPLDAFGNRFDCLVARATTNALLDGGWRLQHKKNWWITRDGMADVFTKGSSTLYLKHYLYYLDEAHPNDDDTCVTAITVHNAP